MNQLLKKTHVIGASFDNIQALRKSKALDFSHAYAACQRVLRQHPTMDVYFFFKMERNVPSLCCIFGPQGCSPPPLCKDSQEDMKTFDELQWQWTPLSNEVTPRMFHLTYTADPDADTDTDNNYTYRHENYDLYIPDVREFLSKWGASSFRTRSMVAKSGFDSIDSFLEYQSSLKTMKIFPIEFVERTNPVINAFYGNADPAFITVLPPRPRRVTERRTKLEQRVVALR
jgi:hypothetical protein